MIYKVQQAIHDFIETHGKEPTLIQLGYDEYSQLTASSGIAQYMNYLANGDTKQHEFYFCGIKVKRNLKLHRMVVT